jgi:hypothetical protein
MIAMAIVSILAAITVSYGTGFLRHIKCVTGNTQACGKH